MESGRQVDGTSGIIESFNSSRMRASMTRSFCNQRTLLSWKKLLFESVFQLSGLFDTPKNGVVTSDMIWLLSASPAVQVIEESLDTAHTEE